MKELILIIIIISLFTVTYQDLRRMFVRIEWLITFSLSLWLLGFYFSPFLFIFSLLGIYFWYKEYKERMGYDEKWIMNIWTFEFWIIDILAFLSPFFFIYSSLEFYGYTLNWFFYGLYSWLLLFLFAYLITHKLSKMLIFNFFKSKVLQKNIQIKEKGIDDISFEVFHKEVEWKRGVEDITKKEEEHLKKQIKDLIPVFPIAFPFFFVWIIQLFI